MGKFWARIRLGKMGKGERFETAGMLFEQRRIHLITRRTSKKIFGVSFVYNVDSFARSLSRTYTATESNCLCRKVNCMHSRYITNKVIFREQ